MRFQSFGSYIEFSKTDLSSDPIPQSLYFNLFIPNKDIELILLLFEIIPDSSSLRTIFSCRYGRFYFPVLSKK